MKSDKNEGQDVLAYAKDEKAEVERKSRKNKGINKSHMQVKKEQKAKQSNATIIHDVTSPRGQTGSRGGTEVKAAGRDAA